MLAADKRGKRSLDELNEGMSKRFGKHLTAIDEEYKSYMEPFSGKPDGSIELIISSGIRNHIYSSMLYGVCPLIYDCLERPELESALDVAERFLSKAECIARGEWGRILSKFSDEFEILCPKAEDFPSIDTQPIKDAMESALMGVIVWSLRGLGQLDGQKDDDLRRAIVDTLPGVVEGVVTLLAKGFRALIEEYRAKGQEQQVPDKDEKQKAEEEPKSAEKEKQPIVGKSRSEKRSIESNEGSGSPGSEARIGGGKGKWQERVRSGSPGKEREELGKGSR